MIDLDNRLHAFLAFLAGVAMVLGVLTMLSNQPRPEGAPDYSNPNTCFGCNGIGADPQNTSPTTAPAPRIQVTHP